MNRSLENATSKGRGNAAARGARRWAPLSVGALLAGCGALTDGAAVGGETHFLITCEDDCGTGLSCIDGVCTRRCEPGYSSCSELAANAECVSAEGASEVFGGSCDVRCSGDADCAPLGAGFSCRSGACRAEPADRQAALSAGRSRAALVRAVEPETCDTGLRWVGGDRPSGEMHPGSDCVGCHRETGARALFIGGTVYPRGGPQGPQPLEGCYGIEGIEVIVTDADGRRRSTVTNRAGNFWFEGDESDFTMPYAAEIRYGSETRAAMATVPTYGGCARCHVDGEVNTEFQLNPEDPEYVNRAGVIFTPGLFP